MDPPEKPGIFSGLISHCKNGSRQRRVDRLAALISERCEVDKEKLTGTVDYIEDHKKELIRKIKKYGQKCLYLRPGVHGVPYHVLIYAGSKHKKPRIYIHPKQELLGEGSFKVVRTALDYRKCALVAEATMKGGEEEIEKGKEEVELQKQFGVSLADYHYVRKGIRKLKTVIPFANRGSLENLTYPVERKLYDELTASQRIQLMTSLLESVEKIHRKGYVVADIKPENFLWTIDDKGRINAFVTDFGLSYHVTDKEKERICGTTRTIAPEIVDNILGFCEPIGQPVDIFALGFVLWNVFAGGTPSWLLECSRLGGGGQHYLEPESYQESWSGYLPVEGSLEYYIHRMMDPLQEDRPTIQEIVKNLKGKDPRQLLSKQCGGVRLMTYEEGLKTIDLFLRERNLIEKDWLKLKRFYQQYNSREIYEDFKECAEVMAIPLNKYYLLSQHESHPDSVRIFFLVEGEGRYRSVFFKNDEKMVNAFIQASEFTICLNFWHFVK